MDNRMCSRCHKMTKLNNFLRKNYKNTGDIREWKICNECNINKLKLKIIKIDELFNKKYNFITPYNEQQI